MSRWMMSLMFALPFAAHGVAKPSVDQEILKPQPNARAPQLTIDKGAEITVEDYDAKTDTFMLSLNEQSGVGPNFVTPEMLKQAVAFSGDQRDFMKQRNQMIGSIYQLKNPLPLVREDEMERRNKAARSNKRAF